MAQKPNATNPTIQGDMKMNYNERSDTEIASEVLESKKIPYKITCGSCFIDNGYEDGACTYTFFDPCNRPQDAWPIIVEERIGITPHGDKWMANNFNPSNIGDYQIQTMCYDAKPLRSAMICFLKMKHEEQNNDDT